MHLYIAFGVDLSSIFDVVVRQTRPTFTTAHATAQNAAVFHPVDRIQLVVIEFYSCQNVRLISL